jgi:hypothetical protein
MYITTRATTKDTQCFIQPKGTYIKKPEEASLAHVVKIKPIKFLRLRLVAMLVYQGMWPKSNMSASSTG